jgi:hypothetical protein
MMHFIYKWLKKCRFLTAFIASGVAVMLRIIEPNPIAELRVATTNAGVR